MQIKQTTIIYAVCIAAVGLLVLFLRHLNYNGGPKIIKKDVTIRRVPVQQRPATAQSRIRITIDGGCHADIHGEANPETIDSLRSYAQELNNIRMEEHANMQRLQIQRDETQRRNEEFQERIQIVTRRKASLSQRLMSDAELMEGEPLTPIERAQWDYMLDPLLTDLAQLEEPTSDDLERLVDLVQQLREVAQADIVQRVSRELVLRELNNAMNTNQQSL